MSSDPTPDPTPPPRQHYMLDLFVQDGVARDLEAGELLYKEGSEPDRVYFIKAGRLKLYNAREDGLENQIGEKVSGSLLGESSALDQGPRTVSVRAIEAVTVLTLPSSTFRDRLQRDATLCFQVAMELARTLRSAT